MVVPVTVPAKISLAVGAVAEFTEHSPVRSANVATSGTGGLVSVIINDPVSVP